jgi:hypothetical protein
MAVPVVLVVAGRVKGELGHVQRADVNRPRQVETLKDRCFEGRLIIPVNKRAGRANAPGPKEHILMGNGNAMEWAVKHAVGKIRVSLAGGVETAVEIEADEAVELRLEPLYSGR